MKNYELTDFPNLFKNCYWGHFQNDDDDDIIIENRNKFASNYNLKKVGNIPKYISNHYSDREGKRFKHMDHVEVYKNNKQYIIISSPYSDGYDEMYNDSEWEKINPLYSPEATTYLKIINMK